jgi:hypothetical protein
VQPMEGHCRRHRAGYFEAGGDGNGDTESHSGYIVELRLLWICHSIVFKYNMFLVFAALVLGELF